MGAWARPFGLLICLGLLAGLGACASNPSGHTVSGGYGVPAGAHPRIVSGGRNLQCVPYARAESGIQIRGDAYEWWAKAAGSPYGRSSRPAPGSVIVLHGYASDKRGHLAVVRSVVDARTIIVDHANWLNDGRIHLSSPVRDVSRGNDWSQVRVWHTPSGSLGQRIYAVEGFILPRGQRVAAR